MGQHEEVIRCVFEPDFSRVGPAAKTAFNDVNEQARQHVGGGGGGGSSSSGPRIVTDATSPLFGSGSRGRKTGEEREHVRAYRDATSAIREFARILAGLRGTGGVANAAHAAANLFQNPFVQRVIGGGSAPSPAFNPVAGHARIINPDGSVGVAAVRRVVGGGGGRIPPVPPAAGGAAAGGGGGIIRVGNALGGAGTASAGAGVSGAAAIGVIGLAAAGVVAHLKNIGQFAVQAAAGLQKMASTVTTGNATNAIKGFVSTIQAGARMVGTWLGGPMLGGIFSRVVGVGNKFVDALDHLVDSLGKFNPIVAMHARQYEVQQKMFKMRAANAFQGVMSEWIKFKGGILDLVSNLLPLFKLAAAPVQLFIRVLNWGVGALKTGLQNLVAGITWAFEKIKNPAGGRSFAEILKSIQEGGLANAAKKYTAAFINAGRGMASGNQGAAAQGGGNDGSGKGPQGVRGGSGPFQPGAPVPRGPRGVPGLPPAPAFTPPKPVAPVPMPSSPVSPSEPRITRKQWEEYRNTGKLPTDAGVGGVRRDYFRQAFVPDYTHTFGGGRERQRNQRILRRMGADPGFRLGYGAQSSGVKPDPYKGTPPLTSYSSPFKGMKSYRSPNSSNSSTGAATPTAKAPERVGGSAQASAPLPPQPNISAAMLSGFKSIAASISRVTNVNQQFQMSIANDREVHEGMLRVRDRLNEAVFNAGLEAHLALSALNTHSDPRMM